jgi:hypothetical protein
MNKIFSFIFKIPLSKVYRHSRTFVAGIYFVDARQEFRFLNPALSGIRTAGHSGMTRLSYYYLRGSSIIQFTTSFKKFIFAFVFVLQALYAQPNPTFFSSDSVMLFVPFSDISGFNGKWNIGIDVPRYLSAYSKERFRVGVVSPLSVRQFVLEKSIDTLRMTNLSNLRAIAENFHVRYIVSAEIEEFSVGRFIVSDVQLAGYEAFAATVKINFVLYDATRFTSSRDAVVYEGIAEGTVKDRSLGITLWGKRTDRTNQYFMLDDVTFGGELFHQSILGEALLKCADELGTKLERAIPLLVTKSVVLSSSVVIDTMVTDSTFTIKRQLINGEVVIVDDGEVFINLGSADGISIGDILPVYNGAKEITDPKTGELLGSRDEKIGEVQVIELRAEHLCLASIISGKEKIAAKQRIRKVIVR